MSRALYIALGPLVLAAGCRRTADPLHLQRMIDQPHLSTWEATRHFPDGSSMQQPPDGARPWIGSRPSTARPPLSRSLLERGRRTYEIQCAPCHGLTGDANTPVARHMEIRPPRDLLSDEARRWLDTRIYDAITEGYGLMPSYAEAISIHDRWAVVSYVRALQLSQRTTVAELPSSLAAEARRRLR